MYFLSVLRNPWRNGSACIGLGLLVIVAAQFWSLLPIVTAIALIGRGAVLTLQTGPRSARQDSLVMINLSVYSMLVCLAIVVQSNAVLRDSAMTVSLRMLLDHAAAIVMLLGIVCRVFQRLIQPSS